MIRFRGADLHEWVCTSSSFLAGSAATGKGPRPFRGSEPFLSPDNARGGLRLHLELGPSLPSQGLVGSIVLNSAIERLIESGFVKITADEKGECDDTYNC